MSYVPAIPERTYLASQALPAAGAYTVPTALSVPAGIKHAVFEVEYTRGAAGGQPSFVFYSGSGGVLRELPLADLTYAPFPGKASSSASLYRFALPSLLLEDGQNVVGIAAAETGVAGTPGTIAIFVTMGGGS